jgi:phospholipid-binding lipoprotein MlaA
MKAPHAVIAVLACVLALAGCASAPASNPRDPLESFNRDVSAFNRDLDHATLQPAAKAYDRGLPRVVRTGVANFFGNIGDLWSAVNSGLQLKPVDAVQNSMRFAVNTVFGLGGLIDIATDAGIERHKQDFGMTLARWGVPDGPYLVLPIFGPSTLRDALALPVDLLGDPLHGVTPIADRTALLASRAVDKRSSLLPLDAIVDSALDPYAFMRDAYLQHRGAQTHRLAQGSDGALVAEPAASADAGPPAAPQ